jgi:hypothetical protein
MKKSAKKSSAAKKKARPVAKAAAKKRTTPAPKAKARAAAKPAAKPAPRAIAKPNAGGYTPQPIAGMGWAPFRYPLH